MARVAALIAVAGSLAGMVGMTLVLALGHTATLVPAFFLMGKVGGLFKPGTEGHGVMHERSARVGLVTSLLCALINGTWAGPMLGAGCMLESIHGRPVPVTFVQWGTMLGLLAGGIVGLAALGRQVYRGMPENWRAALRGHMPALPR